MDSNKIRYLYKAGYTVSHIAEKTGVSVEVVTGVIEADESVMLPQSAVDEIRDITEGLKDPKQLLTRAMLAGVARAEYMLKTQPLNPMQVKALSSVVTATYQAAYPASSNQTMVQVNVDNRADTIRKLKEELDDIE